MEATVARAGDRTGGDGPRRPRHAAALHRFVQLDSRTARYVRANRLGLRGVHAGPLRDLSGDHAAGVVLRRHDPAADYASATGGGCRRVVDRTGVRTQYAGLDRGCDSGRVRPDAGGRPEGAHRGRRGAGYGPRNWGVALGCGACRDAAETGLWGGRGGRIGCGPRGPVSRLRPRTPHQWRLSARADQRGGSPRDVVLPGRTHRHGSGESRHRFAVADHQHEWQAGRIAACPLASGLLRAAGARPVGGRCLHANPRAVDHTRPQSRGAHGRGDRAGHGHVVPLFPEQPEPRGAGDDRDRA